ncbi:hypothetical protein D3C86_1799380 [compost metagenome]
MVTRHATALQAFADRCFVAIGGGGIDQAIAGLHGIDDTALAFGRIGDLENTVAEDRHLDAVVQGYFLHDWLLFRSVPLLRLPVEDFLGHVSRRHGAGPASIEREMGQRLHQLGLAQAILPGQRQMRA